MMVVGGAGVEVGSVTTTIKREGVALCYLPPVPVVEAPGKAQGAHDLSSLQSAQSRLD
jgi:hypothetical protein